MPCIANRDQRPRRGELGASRLKTIMVFAVLGFMAYVGLKVIPVLLSEYEFQDVMKTTARFAAVNRQGPDDIRKVLLVEAAKEDLPVHEKDIQVNANNGTVQIRADFSVIVDLQFYQWTINF